MINTHEYAAIDPLALIFTGAAYLRLVEKIHPNMSPISEIQEVVRSMSPDDQAYVLNRAKLLVEHGKVVEEALLAAQE